MRFPKELVKGTTKHLILAVLQEEEMYGYQIVRQISTHSDGQLEFGEGSIYPALHALEKSGLLASRWVAQDGRPDRKYYRLTPKGVRELTAGRRMWQEFTRSVEGVLQLRTAS